MLHIVAPKELSPGLRVFLCHSSGDKPTVRILYKRLKASGFIPWLDEEDLLPGEDWEQQISIAIGACHAVLVCLSKKSINKEGFLQKEIRNALSAAEEKPAGAIFLIPLKLEECTVPDSLRRWQWVDLFDERGYEKLLKALNRRATAVGITIKSGERGAHRGNRIAVWGLTLSLVLIVSWYFIREVDASAKCSTYALDQDYQRAQQCFTKAEAAGNTAAMNRLGEIYEKGYGVQPDLDQAWKHYEKAATAGNPEGMFHLGILCEGKEDYAQARMWFEKSAAGGDALAMFHRGQMDYFSWGIKEPNFQEARNWYKKACDKSNDAAMNALGYLYEKGLGGEKSGEQAVFWYQKAADKGNAAAMNNLGAFYELQGLTPLACEWYKKAARADDENAKKRLQSCFLWANNP